MMIGRNRSGGDDRLNHLVSILLLFLSITTTITNAFSLRSNNAELLSNLQTIQAELLISIGRVPGTAMPPEWAASGAKLGFTLEVEFTNEQAEYEMSKERLLRVSLCILGMRYIANLYDDIILIDITR
mgnify:CR=1 FL=1